MFNLHKLQNQKLMEIPIMAPHHLDGLGWQGAGKNCVKLKASFGHVKT